MANKDGTLSIFLGLTCYIYINIYTYIYIIYIHTYIYILYIYVYVHTPFLHLSSEKVCVQVTAESPSLRSGLAEAGLLQRSRLGGVTAGSWGLAESRDRSDFHHIEAIKIFKPWIEHD